jgi:hypothetical protein
MLHRIVAFTDPAFRSFVRAIPLFVALSSAHADPSISAYDGIFMSNWQRNVATSQDEQPHWESLLGMASPRLTQGFRYNYARQYSNNGSVLENYGMGKGLDLIADQNFEIQIGVPAYLEKQSHGSESRGWADEALLGRYRLVSANEEEGNYIVSGSLGVSVPTGSGQFSVRRTVFTPTLAGGKGWGTRFHGFSIQSSISAAVPDGNFSGIGMPMVWSTAFQAHSFRYVWPEVETTYTHWYKGAYDGKSQLILTYGLVFGRVEIEGRRKLTLGIGYQEPVGTHFSTFSREWISMLKLSF